MKRFFKSDSFKVLVIIAAVAFLGVMCAAFSHNASTPATSVMSFIFTPLQKLSSAVSSGLGDLSASFESASVYKEENDELKEELAEYREKLADYDELKSRIDAYEKFYDIKKANPDYKFSYGTVISRDSFDAYGSFVINTGSKDGVKVNDPVIYGSYVVGVVSKVNASTAVVRTVLDPRVNLGAFESGTREYGYVSGEESLFGEGLCRLSGLSSSTSVVSGGTVCTSGSGGVFPNGLLIGEIVSVEADDVSAAYFATVKPFAEFDEISDVFVITSFEGQGEGDIGD